MSSAVLFGLVIMLGEVLPSNPPGRVRQIEHFTPSDYGAYPQNWAIVQDPRSFIYVGNRDGILQFDGQVWSLIPTGGTTVRSLAYDGDGRVYVGTQGDFGLLETGPSGHESFRSLLDQVPASERDFADVWSTATSKDGVFFHTRHRLFLWNGERMRLWASETGFHTFFVVASRYFIREIGVGLLEWVEGDFVLVPGGESLSDIRVSAVLPRGRGEFTVITRDSGLFRFDNHGVRRLHAEVDPLLRQFGAYNGILLSTGRYAIATLGGGVVITDVDGNVVEVLGKGSGLPDDVVNFVSEDREGNLWLALNSSGVARIDYGSPLRRFGDPEGLDGTIADIGRSAKGLGIATSTGLYWLGEDGKFQKDHCVSRSWDIETVENGTLVATDEGLFFTNAEHCEEISSDQSFRIAEVIGQVHRRLVGTKLGIRVIQTDGGRWTSTGFIDLNREVRLLYQDTDGWTWVATRSGGPLRVRLVSDSMSMSTVEEFEGIPEGRVTLLKFQDEIAFNSHGRLLDYDRESRSFVTSWMEKAFLRANLPDTILSVREDSRGITWLLLPNRVSLLWNCDDVCNVEDRSILRFPETYQSRIFVEDSGVAWISRGDELFRYDPHVVKNYDVPYGAFVRRITDLRTDSTLFGGSFQNDAGGLVSTQPAGMVPQFEYELNNLRFLFAAPTFNSPSETVYRYQLVGRDDDWSEWGGSHSVAYSDLVEGRYEFRVRARNGFGIVSEIGSYSFFILPPWYRTWWAYSIYAVGAFALFIFSWNYASMARAQRQAEEQARELARERVMNERLNEANDQLKVANIRLQEAITLKDEFLATTSHELRTPITAILGYASILREEIPPDYQEFVDIIEKSGERLMATLNALLDLAKLRAGTMDISVETVNVAELITKTVDSRRSTAESRGVPIDLTIMVRDPYLESDEHAICTVVDNLIDNAIKFTEHGKISVVLSEKQDAIRIEVVDTGVGVDKEFLPVLFDEFRQESGGLSRSHPGNGLGLAIVAGLVSLLSGSIDVRSVKGKGSTFTVVFPRELGAGSESAGDEVSSTRLAPTDRDPVGRRSGSVAADADPVGGPASDVN